MKPSTNELKSIREPKDADTESRWWTIWATHNANDATIQETAQTFGTDRTTAWRAIAWCSRELKDGRGAAECIEGQIYTKKQRLREVRKMRAECMGNKDHTPALGYLREERELEHDIAELEGAKRLLVSIEHTGPGGAPVQHNHTFEHLTVADLARLAANGDGHTDSSATGVGEPGTDESTN